MEKKNLDEIIIDKQKILKFIESNFKPIEPDREELRSTRHSLSLEKFNRVLQGSRRNFYLFTLPIKNIYAYIEATDSFCLYLLIDLDLKMLLTFIDDMGFPENVLPYDIENNDFDFLVWSKKNFDIVMLKDRIGGNNYSPYTSVIFQISNIKGTMLSDDRKLFGLN